MWLHAGEGGLDPDQGMLMLLISYVFFQSARHEFAPFFRWTVHCRVAIFFFFGYFVLSGLVASQLMWFGVADLLGAAWTAVALSMDAEQRSPGTERQVVSAADPNLRQR